MEKNDTYGAIREAQNALRLIARFRKTIPLIAVDGVFGEETVEAVKAFQQEYGLMITGEIDEVTWNQLIGESDKINRYIAPPRAIEAFLNYSFIISKGAVGEPVLWLQIMLIRLGNTFANIPPLVLTGVFDEATENAVKSIQNKSALESNGVVDRFTWDKITELYNIYSKVTFPVSTK